MGNFNLLDTIITSEKTLEGVIDYASTKYVIFYDLTRVADPKILRVVLIWRSYYSHIRFSVFKEIYFRGIDIAQPVQINKKVITNHVPTSDKPKRRVERFSPSNATVE